MPVNFDQYLKDTKVFTVILALLMMKGARELLDHRYASYGI